MSSASGHGQFIDSTFVAEFRRAFPDRVAMTDKAVLVYKNDADITREVILQCAKDNTAALRAASVAVSEQANGMPFPAWSPASWVRSRDSIRQSKASRAALVSFNLDAFESFGHEQRDNAPVSEAAAFAYTTTLNRFLERGSKHRVRSATPRRCSGGYVERRGSE